MPAGLGKEGERETDAMLFFKFGSERESQRVFFAFLLGCTKLSHSLPTLCFCFSVEFLKVKERGGWAFPSLLSQLCKAQGQPLPVSLSQPTINGSDAG